MRKVNNFTILITLILALTLLIVPLSTMFVSAIENTDIKVTATTSTSVKQGNSDYCYVYIDSLENLSTLSVTVHYDPNKIKVESWCVYNNVSCTMHDKAVGESSVQFTYIFDGNGEAYETQLFYFMYTVLSDAEVGDTYFDIVVNDAYDSLLNAMPVSGSRLSLEIDETIFTKECYMYSPYWVNTSVGEEFELYYSLSTYQVASGSFIINYDPELFEVVGVTNGALLNNKIVDVNTNLEGAVYISFVGTEYNYNYDLVNVKFKTIKNVAEQSTIKMTVTEFYDLELNPISCNACSTTAGVEFDESYIDDAPSMTLQSSYDAQADKVILTIRLDKDSRLGAGDFVLNFDTTYLTYDSVQKGFSPTYFIVNEKNVDNGVLKFSIISLSDITDEQTVLTVMFDVKHACEDNIVDFEISGSGLADSLTKPIQLNFVDTNLLIPLKHTIVTDKAVDPTCTETGLTEGKHCEECGEVHVEQEVIDALGHDYVATEVNDTVKYTCSECGDEFTIGDVNGDGRINGTDVTLLRRYITGGYGVSINELAADINGDGRINGTDVTLLRRYITGGYGVVIKPKS